MDEQSEEGSAFSFHGSWQEFAKIAFPNLLLTIVTLGIYRFWATTRERQYLWGRTQFIDETLEWTGTGMELFKGFLLAIVVFIIPVFVISSLMQWAAMSGHPAIAGFAYLGLIALILFFLGFARFRALRYRLSRTYWHGIRGGSDDSGLTYGISSIWKTLVGGLALGLMVPWSQMSLWNERWNDMSYGPHRFESAGLWNNTFKRWLLIYGVVIGFLVIVGILMASIMASAMSGPPRSDDGMAAVGVLMAVGIYPLLGLAYLAYYAKFFREGIAGLSLSTLDFHFHARTVDWLKLIIVDVLLVIGTLGIGYIFLSYRHWKFFVSHLEASGEIDLNALTQSTTSNVSQGEGLLDALDVGAF